MSLSFGSGMRMGSPRPARRIVLIRASRGSRRGIIPSRGHWDRLAPLLDLLEYQGKRLFAKHDVPVPDGRHAASVDEAVAAADQVGYPCVVKAQVAIGKRGKA